MPERLDLSLNTNPDQETKKNDEKTEELLGPETSDTPVPQSGIPKPGDPKPFKSEPAGTRHAETGTGDPKKRRIIIIAAAAVLLIAAGWFGFTMWQNSQYSKQLDLAQKYLEDGNYEDAVLAYESAVKIADNRQDAYEGLAKAASQLGDNDQTGSAYQKLYDLTGDSQYQVLAEQAQQGSSSGNLSNGGQIVQAGDSVYAAVRAGTNSNISIVKIQDDQSTMFVADTGSRWIYSLNIYNGYLYYSSYAPGEDFADYHYDYDIYRANLSTGETERLPIEDSLYLSVYKGRIYYIVARDCIIYSSALDGTDVKKLIEAPQPNSVLKAVSNDTIYYVPKDGTGIGDYPLWTAGLDGSDAKSTGIGFASQIRGFSLYGDKAVCSLYYNQNLYSADLSAGTSSIIGSATSFNASSSNIFDVNLTGTNTCDLIRTNMDGTGAETIDSQLSFTGNSYNQYTFPANAYLTDQNVYIIGPQAGGGTVIYRIKQDGSGSVQTIPLSY